MGACNCLNCVPKKSPHDVNVSSDLYTHTHTLNPNLQYVQKYLHIGAFFQFVSAVTLIYYDHRCGLQFLHWNFRHVKRDQKMISLLLPLASCFLAVRIGFSHSLRRRLTLHSARCILTMSHLLHLTPSPLSSSSSSSSSPLYLALSSMCWFSPLWWFILREFPGPDFEGIKMLRAVDKSNLFLSLPNAMLGSPV